MWGAVIQGASDVSSSALGAIFAKKAAKKQFKRQVSAYKQRYQWTMEDMRKAGLNPILAAGQGAGSAPNAAMASAPSGKTSDYAGSISKSKRLSSEIANIDAQTEHHSATTLKENNQAALATEQMYQTRLLTNNIRELHPHAINTAAATARITKAGVPLAELDAYHYGTQGGQTARQIQRYLEATGGLSLFNTGARLFGGRRGGKYSRHLLRYPKR